MRAFIVLVAFSLTSCGLTPELARNPEMSAPVLSAAKQKQKIFLLEKRIAAAEKQKEKADEELKQLQTALSDAQLAMVRKQLTKYQKLKEKKSKDEGIGAFEEERKALHEIISRDEPGASYEAQIVLDEILELITDQSNSKRASSTK